MNLLRRIVTGHDADGRSIVLSDEKAPAEGQALGQLYAWGTAQVPAAAVARTEDIDAWQALHDPPRQGLKVFFVEFPPDDGVSTDAERRAYAGTCSPASVQASPSPTPRATPSCTSPRPWIA